MLFTLHARRRRSVCKHAMAVVKNGRVAHLDVGETHEMGKARGFKPHLLEGILFDPWKSVTSKWKKSEPTDLSFGGATNPVIWFPCSLNISSDFNIANFAVGKKNTTEKEKTRWSPRTRMPTHMLTNRDNTYLSHFQQTHLWDALNSHTEVTLL